MSSSTVNKVILIANLGQDPEVKSYGSDNRKVVNLSVATSDRWRDRETKEWREKVEWHRVSIYNPHLADIADRYLKKGAKVYIEGRLETQKWQDSATGADRSAPRVVVQQYAGELVILSDGGGALGDPIDTSGDSSAK